MEAERSPRWLVLEIGSWEFIGVHLASIHWLVFDESDRSLTDASNVSYLDWKKAQLRQRECQLPKNRQIWIADASSRNWGV